jgi:hypothetical protein
VSNILAQTYDGAADVTKSDTVADPAGPFAGLLVSVAGTLKLTTVRGYTVAFTVVAGQEVHIATQRVWSTGTSATVIGLLVHPFAGPKAVAG